MIDFKEIPEANTGGGLQDTFELFARDFFKILGYDIIQEPTRGADGGKDLIIKEMRKGQSDLVTEVTWLVSCKHYAHSGKAINPSIENNINDRIKSNNCDGFIAFYSTLPTHSLSETLKSIPHQILDYRKIESYIIGNKKYQTLFLRYFPRSYKRWELLNLPYNPIKLFKFYIDHNSFEIDLSLLMSIFLSVDKLFIALVNSNDFKEFLDFKHIKIFISDNLSDEYNEMFHKSNIDTSNFINLVMTNSQLVLSSYLNKNGYADEKVVVTGLGSLYILSTNTLILDNKKLELLERDYLELKKII